MNKITKEKLTALTDGTASPSVTIYMPTHKAPTPPHMQEDQTRFKNLVSKTVDQLGTDGTNDQFTQEFKQQTSGMMEDIAFWEDMTESLLICARPGMFEYFNLPIESDEYVAVDDHFHLAPLLGLIDEFQPYYLLAVKQKQPFLLYGDAYGLKPSELKLPASIAEALNIDEMHLKSNQFYSIQGGAGAEFHGHGGAKDAGDSERRQFMKIINDKVSNFVDSNTPIVLAGTTDEVTEFTNQGKLQTVLPEHVHGSYTEDQAHELHGKAHELLRKHVIEPQHAEVIEQFERLAGQNPDRVENSMAGIKDAAEKGRVETLLLGVLQYTTDTIRDNKEKVVKLTFPAERSRQAMDYLAQLVWRQGGRIINLYAQKMPQPSSVLAINRY